ncbi:MAG: hypothetical protein E2576_10980 [Alcaligenaceae bacterium]|nr:hypothetical protein [Alcaligenaceae bacterium SAGV5]MPS51269.1 hypothetical protein [Alcaligenaceae bacterium SAGV3]MPT57234.1 hypothetical protein [Alcaligenaceae bacterium]
MTEPSSGVAAWLAGAATAGAVLGLQYDALVPGLLGGLMALSFAAPTTRMRMALAVATSTVLAGYGAPVAAVVLMQWLPPTDAPAARALSAVAIGLLAQQLVIAAQAIVTSAPGAVVKAVADLLARFTGGSR